ncbi:MAG: hypothetical protein ACRENK_07890, partial [Gemmatimonadaceae bacterium]
GVLSRALPMVDRRRVARYLAELRTWRCFTTERVTAKVATIVLTRYRDDKEPRRNNLTTGCESRPAMDLEHGA